MRSVVATFLERHLIRDNGITLLNDAIASVFWLRNSMLANAEA